MSSYGQHAPSTSFKQDSALVAQFASQDQAERDFRSRAPFNDPEEVAVWNDTTPYESRPRKPTIGRPVLNENKLASTNERTPLVSKPSISRIHEAYEGSDGDSHHDFDYRRMFLDELKTLARYTLPVFGCASRFSFSESNKAHPVSYLFPELMYWRYLISFDPIGVL